MNFYEEIIYKLQYQIEQPKMYGVFHLGAIFICILFIISLLINIKKKDFKTVRKYITISIIILLILETLKLSIYSFTYDKGTNTGIWEFDWYVLPVSFCSMPLYIGTLSFFFRKGKFLDSLYLFLGTYGLIGGLLVMLFPSTVLSGTLFLSIQTFVHHGFMLAMGLVILSKIFTPSKRTLLNAIIIFTILVSIGTILNVVFYYTGIHCNAFTMSPYLKSDLPVFSNLFGIVNSWILILLYILVFSLGSCAVYGIRAYLHQIYYNRHYSFA
ncbi:MAG: YwaF family protein [Acholeplasmatales bacterium]|jgi:hypothetical protein|nr:YwaF family protein [Acholeplasmatales bacterium]